VYDKKILNEKKNSFLTDKTQNKNKNEKKNPRHFVTTKNRDKKKNKNRRHSNRLEGVAQFARGGLPSMKSSRTVQYSLVLKGLR
jgi:hypothetical protein